MPVTRESTGCTCQYTGDEPSPKGMGKCAHCQTEGFTATGTDNKLWIVTSTEDGTLKWYRDGERKRECDTSKDCEEEKVCDRKTKKCRERKTKKSTKPPTQAKKGQKYWRTEAKVKLARGAPRIVFGSCNTKGHCSLIGPWYYRSKGQYVKLDGWGKKRYNSINGKTFDESGKCTC